MISASTPILRDRTAGRRVSGTARRCRLRARRRSLGQEVVPDRIDNPPHVPFFLPIIDELRAQGIEIILTARNIYQDGELLEFFQLPCKVIGRHYGKNKFLKVAGNCLRTVQLAPTAAGSRPDLAVSHGSRAQLLISKAMRIPTMMLHDYEHSTKTGFI